MCKTHTKLLLLLAGVLIACAAAATTYTDNFTETNASLQWTALNDACLTAGDGTGSIPKCPPGYFLSGMSSTAGQGALLLTPAQNNQTGAILSAFAPFPLSQGIQVTFTTYTFGGDSGGLARNGADGIVFFLTSARDAGSATSNPPPTTTGALGGSMGYDCSNGNSKYDGIANGYLGLGIDEYGNFLNTGDNGSVGIYNSNDPKGSTTNGTNTYYNANGGTITAGAGPQYQPERIGLRGAGNTNWAWLQSVNSSYYSGSSNIAMVQAACRSGQYVSGGNGSKKSPYTYAAIPFNYNAIPGGYAILPNSQPIANNSKSATNNPTASTSPSNVAWPITYRLQIAPNGLMNFAYSYNNGAFQPVLTNANITAFNGPLPVSLRFGFSAGTGGSNNVHEITCFEASPLQSNSSASSNTVQGGKVVTGTQLYLASFSSNNWWGSLVAQSVMTDPATGSIFINDAANWDAKCVLTGASPCDSMTSTDPKTKVTTTHNITAQSPASRTLLTSTAPGAGSGVTLAWGNLSTAQQTALNVPTSNSLDTTPGQNRVQWLLGNRAVEQLATGCTAIPASTPPCDLRARTYVLGDIIDSSPTFVGAPTVGGYPDVFNDALNPAANASAPENQSGAQAYSGFVSTYAGRENLVYVGSNDGFVHGFEAGSYNKGAFASSANDGKELIGYMPYDVLLQKAVNLADPLYKHDYLVDATPAAGAVFYNNAWHTWLVGGVGSSGQEIYALDITDPSQFSSNPASKTVIGDWDSSTLTHLGSTVGTPIIARLHNGSWAIIFGSGLVPAGATSPQTEGVYIGLIGSNGSVSFQFLDTGAAPTGVNGAAGGIAYVTAADLDGDHIADYLYAGDTQGNVWRFDVTSSNQTKWVVSSFGHGATPTPLFVAKDSAGNRQPITTAVKLGAILTGTVTRAMVYFGTGQLTPQTTTAATQYAAGTQTFYGIWDWDMSAWDGQSNVQYVSLTGMQSITRSTLFAQSVVAQNPASGTQPATRTLSSAQNVVCWADNSACTPGQFGWRFDLPDQGPTSGQNAGQNEQIIYNPTFIGGAVVVNTATPPQVNASTCNAGLQRGWTMAFNPATGGGLPQDFFPNSSGGFSSGSATISGIALSGVGTPIALQYGGNSYLITQTVTGGAKLTAFNPQSGSTPGRVSWRELVNP